MSATGCSSIPEARRRDQGQARDIVGLHRRHLGGDHAAHGVADEDRVLQAERVDHVPGVEREIQHVADFGRLLAVAVAGQQRRVDVILCGQRLEERVVGGKPAGAVQEDERRDPCRPRSSGPARGGVLMVLSSMARASSCLDRQRRAASARAGSDARLDALVDRLAPEASSLA